MIGIFNDNFPPILDGVALTAQNYAYWLHQKGKEVCVVTPYAPDSEEVINAAPYPVYRYTSIPIPMRKPYRLGLPYMDWGFLAQKRKLTFEIVHAHCPFTSGRIARRIAHKQHIPMVATFHSKYRQDFERAVHSKFIVDLAIKDIMAFYESADEVWIPQASVEDTIREYGYKGRVEVVENGNDFVTPESQILQIRDDMRKQLGLNGNETMLLYVGQHIWEKNIQLTLDALKKIKELPYRLYMIGTGYAEGLIREFIHKEGLEQKIIMLGMINDREALRRYYAASDLFLFPSAYDTFGLVVHEAAALQTPSVLLAHSTIADDIEENRNGFLTENDPDVYARLIQHLMENKELLRQAGINASRTMARSWEDIVDEITERYTEIIKRYNSTHQP